MELVKVKRKKISAKEIHENIRKIKGVMEWILSDIGSTMEQMKALNTETEDGKQKYIALKDHLDEQMELYSSAQKEMDAELGILKKYRDSRFNISPKDMLTIVGVSGLAFFMIALERENPKALKLATFVLKLFPIKL